MLVKAPAVTKSWSAEIVATLQLGWPLVVTNLAQIALAVTDVILLGRLGASSLAAGALANNLYFAGLIFGMGVTSAVSPIVAHEIGGRRHSVREVRRTVRQGLWTAAAIAVPVWLILWHTDAILLAIGQEARLASDAATYMRALQWAFLPFLGYIVLRSFIAALERPRAALVVAIGGIVVNALLAWALIFGHFGAPALGLAGAGLASTIANWLMFLGLATVIGLDRRLRRYHVFGRLWQADWQPFRAIWRLGLPIGIATALESTVFSSAAFLMGIIGSTALAAHAIAIQIASTSFMVPLAIGQAATVRVALALGARDREGVRRAGWSAFMLGVAFMGVAATVMLAAPDLLVAIFLDRHDPANAPVATLAVSFLLFAGLFQIVDGAQVVGAGMLRGLHDTRVPMVFAGIAYWVIGLPFGALLAFAGGLGGAGIWLGLTAGLGTAAVLMTLRWTWRERLGLVGR